jgi:hypothetical protein
MGESDLADRDDVTNIGHVVDTIEVSIGPRFLDLLAPSCIRPQ